MDEFRGMKLVRKDGEKNMAVSISVDFDRTKHMSDMTIKRRKVVRDRLVLKEQAKEEEEKNKLQEIENRKERERLIYFFFNWSIVVSMKFALKKEVFVFKYFTGNARMQKNKLSSINNWRGKNVERINNLRNCGKGNNRI